MTVDVGDAKRVWSGAHTGWLYKIIVVGPGHRLICPRGIQIFQTEDWIAVIPDLYRCPPPTAPILEMIQDGTGHSAGDNLPCDRNPATRRVCNPRKRLRAEINVALLASRAEVHDADKNSSVRTCKAHAFAAHLGVLIVGGIHCAHHEVVWCRVEHTGSPAVGKRVECCFARVDDRKRRTLPNCN